MIFREVTFPALAKPLTKMVTFQDYRRPLVLKRGINCSNLAVKRPCNGLWNAHLQDAKNPRSLNVYKIMHRIISPFTSDGKDVAWFESSIWTGYMMLIFIERKLFAGLQISENVVSIPQWWSHISIWKQDHSIFPYQWHPSSSDSKGLHPPQPPQITQKEIPEHWSVLLKALGSLYSLSPSLQGLGSIIILRN